MFNKLKYSPKLIFALILFNALGGCFIRKETELGPKENIEKQSIANENERQFAYNFVNGCSERMKGNLQEALKLFTECKKVDATNSAVHYELGMLYKLLGLNDLALQEAIICAKAEGKNEWYQLLLIDCYSSSKNYAQAVKVREALVKNYPERVEFKQDLAYEYAMMGQYEKALKIYDEIEKNYGVNEQLCLNKLKLYKSLNKPIEAENELKKLINSNKNEARYYAYLADFYIERNELEKAKNVYDQMAVLDPDNPTIDLALHDYYSLNGDEAKAYTYLKKAFANPNLDDQTKVGILNSLIQNNQNDEKIRLEISELADLLIKTNPESSDANGIYADYLLMEKKPKEALPYYYRSAIYNRNNFKVWENLCLLDNDLALIDSLERHSSQALELFPNQPTFYFYNGYANMQLKEYNKAVNAFKDGISFVSNDKSLLLRFYASLGDAANYAKDYTTSDKAYEDALIIDSDNTYVLNNYAYFLSLRKVELEKAAKYSKRSLELKPNEKNYMDTYGWILFQQQKYAEAEIWLSKAAKLAPQNANIIEHYGDALFMNNKPDQAIEQWLSAKELGAPSQKLLDKIKNKKYYD